MNVPRQLWAALMCLLVAACDGESGESGLGEPLQVSAGAFKHGALPGAAADSGDADESLRFTTIETNNTVVHPGQAGKQISGRVTDNGYSVALRFDELGSGYWVVPVGEADSAYPGELDFGVDFGISADLPLGPQRLLFTVIDARGRAGRQQALTLCVTSEYDRTLHACDATQRPPAGIITLTWDTEADLDLIVRTPDGELVDARHPSSRPGTDAQGILYTDDARCAGRSLRREDLVFQAEITPGRYEVFVNLFDACGAAATFFEVSATARTQSDDETYGFEALAEKSVGQALELQANGGQSQGIAITSFEFP